jgi:tRNA A-37 threonylcarbamoyl transferase component Bud32
MERRSQRESCSKYPIAIQTFEGNFNTVVIQLGENGEKSVLRSPKSDEERETTLYAIQQEYHGIGATKNGIGFRVRTPTEQAEFTQKARKVGLKTINCTATEDGALQMDYIDGTPLNKYIQREPKDINTKIIKNVLEHMANAHNNEIIFGDRWGPNTIITQEEDFVELDFDIELVGEKRVIAAFELSQTLYHLMHFAGENRDFIRDYLLDIYTQNPQLLAEYNLDKVRTFMHGQTEYFYRNYQKNGSLYEEMEPSYTEVYELIDGLENIRSRTQRNRIESITLFEQRFLN